MITQVEIQNVACLLLTGFRLTKFHALIGPNDSGKSLILRTISSAVNRTPATIAVGDPNASTRICVETPRGRFTLTNRNDGAWAEQLDGSDKIGIRQDLQSAIVVDFDPPQLRRTSPLLPESQHASFLRDRGAGLPGIYDAILNAGDQSFYKISDALAELFPTVNRLRLNAVSATSKQIEVELVSGQRIPATELSEGILYYLAYAALQYVHPSPILFIEEPENGLHPARIREVMTILRKITEAVDGPQIVLATHSPLVTNEMKPEEVSLVTRSPENGTKVVCIKDTRFFEERHEVMTLGELWLNYCDGVTEAPLLEAMEP